MDKSYDFNEYRNDCPKVKSTINWWEIYPGHLMIINPKYKQELFDEAQKKAGGTYSSLGRSVNICRKSISKWKKRNTGIRIKHVIKIMTYLGRDLNELNNKILKIGGLKYPKLPFNLNTPSGAEIIAAFLSDGHITKNIKSPMYCANEKELHLRLIRLCKEVFGDFESDIKKGHNTPLTRFPPSIGSALVVAGVPRGDKRRRNPFLPSVILEACEDVQTAYIRRVFDDEGDISISKSKRAVRITRSVDVGDTYQNKNLKKEKWAYGISNTPISNLLFGEYLLLRKLGIDARLYGEGVYKSRKKRITAKWRIQIAQQDNIRLFAKKIGFNHSVKKKKLEKVLKSYVNKKSPNGFTAKIIWNHIISLTKNGKSFTFKDIGKKLVALGMTYDFAGAFLRTFTKAGKIKKMKRGVYFVEERS